MPDITQLVGPFLRLGATDIKILVVVDGSIATAPGNGGFGLSRVIDLIDNYSRGCSTFSVDTARRDPHLDDEQNIGHVSTEFRFDAVDEDGALVLDRYDQVWLFGLRGAGDMPLDEAEKAALTAWMNRGGGVFATGDHATLGASMCSDIPRVREMRRWIAGVPSGGGRDRIDTNQPITTAQRIGLAEIPGSAQGDDTPQPISWVPVTSFRSGFSITRRPHEVLCHPELGPIDVMPDHPHEGTNVLVSDMDLNRSYDFGAGVVGQDFPSSGGVQSEPQVIAFGTTVPDPPHDHEKGRVDFQKFPMVSVYDGRSVGVEGRVVTDSTWHHWMDMNVDGLANAADPTAWRKIARYFENLAVWLCPPGRFAERCWFFRTWLE